MILPGQIENFRNSERRSCTASPDYPSAIPQRRTERWCKQGCNRKQRRTNYKLKLSCRLQPTYQVTRERVRLQLTHHYHFSIKNYLLINSLEEDG